MLASKFDDGVTKGLLEDGPGRQLMLRQTSWKFSSFAGLQMGHASVTLASYRAGHCSRAQMATDAAQSGTGPGDS